MSQDVSITFPADAGIINVTSSPYNADKTGNVDATAAIQAAINATGENQIVYLPDGVYKISNTLTTPRKNRVQIQGQSKNGTIIRLTDNNPEFAAGTAKKMLIIGEPNHGQSFFNEVRNITFNCGSGNPGTYALHFAANNMGSLRHVKITSDDGQGAIGLDLLASTNGPAFVYDVSIFGYDIGIKNWAFHSIILEKILVENQNEVGVWNQGNGFTIRNLTSNNTVKAVENLQTMLLIDANLTGGSSVPAIVNNGTMYARNISQSGYSMIIENKKGNRCKCNRQFTR
ncbi:MAG: hypothetical protein HC896_03615 [Bacteroidales bacterium]|nr:hypothetical protein [Bacteroidales bacterium]